jgi:hypothetical protein
VCGETGGADVVANLLLFVPFAAGLRLAGLSWRRTVLLSAALSLTVELLQGLVVPGRDASLSDLLTNTTSGAIGAGLGAQLPGALRPSRARAARLLAGGAIVWLAALGLAAWLLTPFVPDGSLISRWAHESPDIDVFAGRVEAVRLVGLAMPRNGVPPDTAALRHRLESGGASLEAQVTSGQPNRDPLWIYMLRAPTGGALTLYQVGRAVGLVVPVRGRQLLARPVTVSLPDGLPVRSGIPVRLHANWRDATVQLSSSYEGVTRTISMSLSPAYGWRLVSPFELATGTGVRWFTAFCLTLSTLPLGYWASRAGPSGVALVAAVIAAGLGALPWIAGLPGVHWSEWVAAGLGAAAGWALLRVAAYLERRCASPSASEFSSS